METNFFKREGITLSVLSSGTFLFFSLIISVLIGSAVCISACGQDTGQWRQLFNGKDLTGWKHAGPGYMSVEDGLLRVMAAWASLLGR
jgi:hypothetical protein